MRSHPVRTSLVLLGLVLVITLIGGAKKVYALPLPPPDGDKSHQTLSPNAPQAPAAPNTAVFTVVYKVAGEKDAAQRDCYNWPVEAQTAFNHAVNLWTTLIYTPSIPMAIHACWTDLPAADYPYGYDAQPASWIIRRGAPEPGINSYYPAGLANTWFGEDLTPNAPEITISCNRGTPWYYALDGHPPANQYDFLTAALRQITYGLGFRGFMKVVGTNGYWIFFTEPTEPALYDRFVVIKSENRALITYDNGSPGLANKLQSEDLYFEGYSAGISNGGTNPPLHAPNPWQPNSSYISLHTSYRGTENGLMTPPLPGTAYHDPGPVTLGILRDLGWDITRNSPPLLLGLPDVQMPMNSILAPVIDLWPYASDAESADDAFLTFSVDPTTPSNPGVSIYNGHFISISLQSGWHGSAPVTIRVTDPDDAYDLDTFIITTTNSAPTISALPNIVAPAGKPYTEVLDLRRYSNDNEDKRQYLTFTISNTPASQAGVSLSGDGGRFLNINAQATYLGKTSVVIKVADRGGLTDSDEFEITVTDQNVTPTINITDQWVLWNTSRTIDLLDWDWDKDACYARDPEGLVVTLSMLDPQPVANAGVSIINNRFIQITPAANWVGKTNVTVQVRDPSGLTAADTFKLVIWRPEPVYLPVIYRGFQNPEG